MQPSSVVVLMTLLVVRSFVQKALLVGASPRSTTLQQSMHITHTHSATNPRESTHSHSHSHPPSPSPLPSAAEEGTTPLNGTLDPSQAQALLSLGVVLGQDPCDTASHRTLACDQGAPYRHILSLHLQYCREGAELPESAWLHLSSLRYLVLEECPAHPFEVPQALAHSLESLTCIASLGTSLVDVLAPRLPGSWLRRFDNLRELSVSDVQVNASSLHAILSNMKHLQHLSFSNTNLKGPLPSTWPSPTLSLLHLSYNELNGFLPSSLPQELPQLESLDLSFNNLQGGLPQELGTLQNLQYLSLASNQLSGSIPTLIQNLTSLIYLDLSYNKFTGSIPSFFTSMPNLRYIDLRGNNLEGVVPFTEDFLRGLNSCKLGGNPGLCYNKSLIWSVEGVLPCEPSSGGGGEGPSPSPSPLSLESDPFQHLTIRHGPSEVVILIALALCCTLGAILMAILLARHCPSKS